MKKVLCIATSLLLMFVLTLTFSAATTTNTDGLPEEYQELYEIIPMGAYGGETITYENLPYVDLATNQYTILIDKLLQEGIIVRPEEESQSPDPKDNPNAPKIPLETVKKTFEGLFGPGSFDKVKSVQSFSNKRDTLTFDEASQSYVYVCCVWGGGDSATVPYKKYVKSEASNGDIILYDKFALLKEAQEKILYADGKILSNQDGEILWKGTNSGDLFAKMADGTLDEYLPVYKHTFKDNGQGGYYWYSTEMIEDGTPLPEGLISDPPAEGSSQETTEGNHTVLGGNWGSTSTQPSTDTQTPAPSEDSVPLWGVIAGCCAVGAALIVGGVLLGKKYKK